MPIVILTVPTIIDFDYKIKRREVMKIFISLVVRISTDLKWPYCC